MLIACPYTTAWMYLFPIPLILRENGNQNGSLGLTMCITDTMPLLFILEIIKKPDKVKLSSFLFLELSQVSPIILLFKP